MRILVRTEGGTLLEMDVEQSWTVEQLKKKICDSEGMSEDPQRLIFDGKQLEDGKLLSDYGIQKESTIYLLQRLLGGGDIAQTGMGDKEGRNLSMEKLSDFNTPSESTCAIL